MKKTFFIFLTFSLLSATSQGSEQNITPYFFLLKKKAAKELASIARKGGTVFLAEMSSRYSPAIDPSNADFLLLGRDVLASFFKEGKEINVLIKEISSHFDAKLITLQKATEELEAWKRDDLFFLMEQYYRDFLNKLKNIYLEPSACYVASSHEIFSSDIQRLLNDLIKNGPYEDPWNT